MPVTQGYRASLHAFFWTPRRPRTRKAFGSNAVSELPYVTPSILKCSSILENGTSMDQRDQKRIDGRECALARRIRHTIIGEGPHVWVFFDAPVRAADMRKLGDAFAAYEDQRAFLSSVKCTRATHVARLVRSMAEADKGPIPGTLEKKGQSAKPLHAISTVEIRETNQC